MRILVLDDDSIQLELAGAALESCGYAHFETSSDAEESLIRLESAQEDFDLYLVDVLMPKIDGIEVCRRIRNTRAGARASIIMMTARSDRDCIDSAFSAGADDYIIKPFDELELSNRIAGVLRRKVVPDRANEESDLYQGEVVDLAECEGLIASDAVEAYLRALDKGRASLSMATAFQVQDWQTLASDLSQNDVESLLACLARIIQSGLSQTTYVLSYFGDGAFICITKRADPAISAGFARRVLKESMDVGYPLSMHRSMHAVHLPGKDPLDLVRGALDGARKSPPIASSPKTVVVPDLFST